MSSIAGLPFNSENKYENPFKGNVQFVGYKTYKMKKIKVLKNSQYEVNKNIVSITDPDLKLGTNDKVFIEA